MAGGGATYRNPGPFAAGAGARRGLLHAIAAWLEERLDDERGRWFLWLPVLYGVGIAAYLGASAEPPLLLCLALLLAAAICRVFLALTALRLIVSTSLLMIALGLVTGKIRAAFVDAPMLTRAVGNAALTGWVERVERHQKAHRLTLRLEAMEGAYKGVTPRRVRLRYHGKGGLPEVGARVKLKASLRPPPEPVIPGGFDFARHHWFDGLGASGFAYGAIELLPGEPPWDVRVGGMVSNLRGAIAARIGAVLSGEGAALAQALIMGERGSISEATQKALTNSGLAHVVSISGFHMALTAGSAFWLIRALLAAFPAVALRFPIKIWAAVAALMVASAYLVISGGAVTAVRSYIMVAIMFGAIILNRPAFSLRNLAISAFLILAVSPESLVDPGFQMSFAATAALIAIYEDGPHRIAAPASWPPVIGVPATMLIGAGATSLAASLAVDPIGAYHFHKIASYSMLGNILAMPVISIIVMPMALLTLVAMPFGLEAGPLLLMGWGIEAMVAIAARVAALPGAVIPVPAFGLPALLLMVSGGLWLLLWRRRWRLWGLVGVAAGLAFAPFAAQPDIWIDREGHLMALRLKDGRLSAVKTRKAEFSLKAWLEADGDGRGPREVAKGEGFQCDDQSCIALVAGKLVSHVIHPAALADDCRRAAILVTSLTVTVACPGPEIIIDGRTLWEKGAHSIRIAGGALHVENTAGSRGRRPWVTVRHRRDLIPAAPDAPATKGKPAVEEADGLPGITEAVEAQ